jgi:amino acid adenylation domain-containing protein
MIQLQDPAQSLLSSPLAEEHPLSWGQRALWMAERLAPGEAPYNLAAAGQVLGELDVETLRGAFEILTARHPALRATFHETAPGEPVQRVHAAMAPDVAEEDVSRGDLRQRLAEEAWRPFDLETGPPLRVRLFTGSRKGAVLLVAVHHLAADLASLSILGQELGALLRDAAAELPPVPASPAEWAERQERLADERRWAYWRGRLAGELPVLALPTDRPRPPILTYRGDSRVLRLGAETLDALRAVSRAEGATLWAALIASVGAWLHRITGQEDLLLGSPVSLRGGGAFASALGYFVELTVLREDLSGRPSFADLLGRSKREAFSALRHAGYPFALLAERLETARDPSRHPVVQILLALQGAGLAAFALAEEGDRTPLGDLELEGVAIPERRLPFDLALLAAEAEGGLAISCQYNAALFDGATVERLLAAFEVLLAGMTADPGRPVAELPLLGEAERMQILGEWSGAGVQVRDEDCLHELVFAQAQRTPEAPAVVHGTERTTYGELVHRAEELAVTLREMGIGPEARVGVLLDRRPEMVVSVLGVLAAGGAYVPLDPAHPAERRRMILEDAGISALITRSGIESRGLGGIPGRPSPRNLAYVLYTSGSTGRPKGVAVEHRSAVARVRWAGEAYAPEDLAGVLAATSLGFDLSVFELFVPLSRGGAVILADDALALPDLPAKGEVTLINTVPSAMAELLRAGSVPASVRVVNLAGEALPATLAEEVHRRLPGARLFNLYGPTEDTVYSTFASVQPGETPLIGRPLAGTRSYVLDWEMQPLPAGVPGELFLGGAGQARGYLGRPDLTAERFVPDPFGSSREGGGRLYRTGDLVRFRADGALDFLGRIDHQVKVRGFRVELGEIEAALVRHPAVEAAAVILREDRLVAYAAGAASPDELRAWLRASLPGPMIPSIFVILDRLPQTPTGKVDRRALPVPSEAAPEEAVLANPTEEILAGIVADVLGVARVGVRDSFFDLGGHSLLAARVVSRVREALGVELPLRALFEEPTVAGLARRIAGAEAPAAPPLVPRPRPGPIPLSFAQERLWFLWSLAPESPFYNMPAALRLSGPLSVPALAGTFGEIVRRQEALRTRFPVLAGGPVQAIDPPSPVPLPIVDLEGLPEAAKEAERLSVLEARRPFDLATGPVLRTALLRLDREEHLLLVTMHHAVSDGWSVAVLHRDFTDLYPALAAGRPSPLAPLPVQYADFTLWQRERPFERELAWWRERLADLPPGDLPSDRPRPAVQTFRGATFHRRIPAERTAELRALSRRLGTTLFMTLLAGFEAVALRWTGREDAVTGAPVAGRDRLELDRVVGFFVNTLVLRTDLSGRPGFAGLARRVRETALGAWAHQALPFERLVEELAPERDLAFQPLFQRMFQLLEMPPERIGLGDLAVERAEVEQGTATFDLALDLVDDPGGVIVKAVYATDLFDEATIGRLLGHFERLLAAAAADPERLVTELPILSEAERQELQAWSAGPEIPEGGSLLESFARHVERTPGKVAVVFGGTTLTYGELDRRSGRLARLLSARGVGPERVVGVLLDRSPELIESLLAIFKAGGAYLPMDSSLPRERLAYFLENAGASLVLTVSGLAEKLSGVETILLPVGCAARPSPQPSPSPLPPFREREPLQKGVGAPSSPGGGRGLGEEGWGGEGADGGNPARFSSLAYLIYTSGSTGRPKAVGVSFEVLSSHIRAMVQAYGVGPEDRILSFAAPGFDVSVEQILMALTAGAAVVLRPNELWEPAGLPQRLADLGVTVADLPPAYWNQLAVEIEGASVPEPRPRLVTAGGDVMQAGPLRRWMRGPWAGVRLWNVYGPTETAITSTAADVTGRGPTAWERVPIGRPLPGRTHYLLDPETRPVPPGVPGEVCVGGPLLARGYLGQPDLTAEKFVPDPWSAEPGGRLYRTGDLARHLPDGELEFVGRTDAQIKIRGFRIEPGEIEAALASHPAVRQAVAVAREDVPGDRRLAAYVTLDADRLEEALAEDLETEQVEEWQAVYDDDVFGEIADPTFNIKGWDSRYTRGPIPADEMREWRDGTVARILALSPRRVLEIGCGTGLLLFPLAPRTERYLGIDFSEPSLVSIRAVLDERGWPAGTELRRGLADDEAIFGEETFDTVVLNSIVQYFPSLAYLLRVVESAVARVRPGGAVFLGDLRSLPLLEASHLSVELFRADGSLDRERLRQQAEAALAAEPELVFDPALFSALARHLPRVTHVEIQLRRGWADNELTRFRYDAVLHVERPGPPEPAWLDWEAVPSLAALRERLLAGPDLLAVRGLPNERVREDVAALALLADPDGPRTAAELRQAAAAGEPGLHPEVIWELGEELGYAVGVTWSTDPGRFDAVFQRSKGLLPGLAPAAPAEIGGLANDPLKRKAAQKIVPALRALCEERLPAWMVPPDIVVLDALPVTVRGKVNLRALPAPERERPEQRGEAALPQTPEERALASLWSGLLGVDRVGLHDNFFALGGHSLLATQVVSRVRQAFAVELPLRHLFEAPTVAGLAACLRSALATAGRLPLPPVEPAPREGDLPLSFGQQRLWFLHRMDPDAPGYLMAGAFRLAGVLSVPALASALSEVVRRHEVLRSTYHEGPVQRIHPPRPVSLPVVDLSGLDPGEEVRRLVRDEAGRPFDLERDLMARGTLLRLGEREHVALLTLHHIASDGWSVDVLIRELAALYGGSPLPDLPIQYGDFAVWQRRWLDGPVLEGQLAWWKERLAGAPPVLELPTDRPRPPVRTSRGGRHAFAVPSDLSAALQDLATREGTTLFVLLLSAWQALLGRITHQEDLVVGTPVAGRRQAETEDLIGFFVNTLVLRADLAEDAAFRDFLARVHNGALDAFAHQDLPFERLVEELNPGRSLAYTPIFQVTFALQHASRVPLELPGLTLAQLPFEPDAKFDLELALSETEDGLAGTLDYAADLFDPATAERLAGLYGNLLVEIVAAPGRRLSDLEVLSEAERRQLAEWGGEAALVGEGTVLDLFDAQVERTPGATAVIAGNVALTYRDLAQRSDDVARRLMDRIQPGDVVGLRVERTADLAIGLLGIWKAGAVFLPIDPSYPAERVDLLIRDSRCACVVGAQFIAPPIVARTAPAATTPNVSVDGAVGGAMNCAPTTFAERSWRPGAGEVAYLIYTSGTTGTPKAVMVEHGSLLHTLRATAAVFGFEAGERMPSIAPFSFDIFLFEVLSPLLTGGTSVILPSADLLLEELPRVTRFHAVPAVLRQVVERAGPPGQYAGLREIYTGGDAVPADLLEAAREAFPSSRLRVLYGPTEGTIVCSFHPVEAEARPLLGKPFPGVSLRLLDLRGNPVPVGVPGEIHVGGPGVARGYLGRPDLTAERFVPAPGGARLYRTGDLARFRPDGALEFMGRVDAQVKVRGVRIEPGEVEARLAAHPGVRQAAVVAREEPGGRILAAFYVPEGDAPEEGELRSFLARGLPEAMIPSRFVPLEALPLTVNAKVDRGALARMELSTPEASAAPNTPTEEILAGLFAEALGVEQVGVRDDFFALGGHSLLATRLVSRVREALGVELPLPVLFEEPTVTGLAGRIGAFSGALLPPVCPVPRDGDLPLSFSQQRLWFLDQMEPGTSLYNMPALLRLIGPLDLTVLRAAFAEVVRRHEALRTTFPARRGAPRQEIHPFLSIPLPLVDLSGLPEEARRLGIEETRRPFDLTAGPLLRALLFRVERKDHVLAVTMHHIVSDGWSVGVLVRELAALYAGETLPPLPVQYADFAVWQREWFAGGVLDTQLSWWRERLAGVPLVLEVPADRSRPPVRSLRGAEVVFEIPANGLAALGRKSGTTLFMTLFAGFQTLLHRITGQDDFLIGTPVAGRRRPEIEGLIGFFVNTLPLPADLSGRPTIRELLERVRTASLSAWAHQDLPFERLVEELDPVRDPSRTPLVQVLFALQDLPLGTANVPGLAIEPLPIPSDTAKMDLTVTLTPRPDGSLAGSIEYAVDLFDSATMERLAERFGRLLAGMAEDPERTIGALPLLSEAERSQMLLWGSGAAVEGTGTIHGLFEEQAERTPDLPAVSWDGGRLTYAELRRRVRRLAARLGALEPEERVAVFSDRSPDFVTALLAILYAGGVYVPLDPEYPAERRDFLLRDSGARIFLTGRDLQPDGDGLPDAGFTPVPVSPDALAYVLYTSGSTGQPKGVEVTHRAVVRLAKGADYAPLGPGETVAQASSVSFDAATFEIWGALLNGAELSVLPVGPTSLEELGLQVEQRGITTLWLTAGLFHQMVDGPVQRLARVRTLLAGGEAVSAPHVRRLLETLPGVAFVNGYGPTENTTFTCCYRVEAAGEVSAPLPIGRPIAGTRVVLLDRDLRPVPPGVPGELCAGGDGLARGYLGRPDLTAAAFVPDPEGVGERLYRTGDLARWRPDGTLEFLGRRDHQVKIRGFRIELGEIEAVLASHPAVGQAAVLVREDRPGDRRLVAFVEGAPGDTAGLRSFLKDRLPGFMVPSALVWLDALPLTGNGKVDRRALAALPVGIEAREGAAPPRTPVEEGIAAIWSEVLGAGVLSRDDDFFELGGHSLLATQVASRLRESFAVELPLRDLFAFPRLADLAARVEEERRAGAGLAAPPVVPVPRPPEGLPLSFAQEWMWVVDQLDPEGAAYNAPIPVSLAGELDVASLRTALRETAARHEILRTVFTPGPLQRVREEAEVPFTLADLSALPPDRREAEAVRQAVEEARQPFDLGAHPPIRALLLRLSPAEHRLVLDLHHIVTDGWSAGVLLREIAALYTGEALAPLPVQYGDFAVWQRSWLSGETLDRLLDHWRERLAGPLPVLELPADRPRAAGTGALGERLPFALTREETDAFRALARQRGATLFAALLAGFTALLHRIAHQDDLLVGTPVAGRTRREVEDLVGYFVNNLVLRTDLGGDPPFAELVDRVQETALDAWSHQDLPLLTLVQALHPERARPGAMPLFQAWFQLQNTPLPAIDLPGLALSPWEIETPAATFDLEMLTMESEDGLRGHLVVNRDLFRRETAERMLGWLLTLLRDAVAAPERRLSELPLLSGEELAQILTEAGPAAAFPEVLPLHRAFEARAAKAPDAPAVTFEGETLSYAELDRRANRLAWHLRSLGVGPEVRVGLSFPRSLDLIVAILGILKAGGAYVPLDPDYPRERLDFLAADADLRVVLTPENLPETGPETPPEVDVDPDALAYVIYTSGSTGRPKGVMVTHRQAARLFSASAFFGFGPGDVWTLFHSYAFDFSVWEIWGALLHGGRLVVVPRWVARSPEAFRDLLVREGVTVLNQTPSAFYQLMQVDEGDLRWVIFGGEALEPAKLRPWLDRHGDERPALVNMFGITETTVHVTLRPLTRADAEAGSVIGAPLPDLSLHLLDRALQPVPPGVVGEIFVGGAGVARGYHGRPDLTAERFLPDPFSAGRLYRSGDLARRTPEGEIEYLGRADQQLKVRGFRIEPGEIESALVRHETVGEAAVLARRVSAEDVRLVAFLAPRAGREIPPAEELRGLLLETLPEHMVPASFVPLPALPLTAHGKVDRRALEDLGETSEAPRAAAELPANPLEERLAALWAELLEVDAVGRDESFFALGGHSLLMTRVATRVREELGVSIPMKSFFDRPTVAGLAAVVAGEQQKASPSQALTPRPPLPPPLSPSLGEGEQETLSVLPLSRGGWVEWRERGPGGEGPGGGALRVTTLAFPTANRPDVLARGLESYAATAPHRRFLVMDDSKDPAVRAEYRRRLTDLQERLGVTILYAGLEEKRRFAADLATEAGVDPAVTEAALLDPFGVGLTVGANRNAVLLATVGEGVLSVDDDTVSLVARSPGSEEGMELFSGTVPGTAFLSGRDPGEIRAFAGREEALASLDLQPADLAGLHEGMLGRPVLVTTNGWAGDCGWHSPSFYMLLEGESLRRLTRTAEGYRTATASKEIVRSVPRVTMGDGDSFMATLFTGLDNRRLLPPFPPVLWGEDLLFGITLQLCFREARVGHLPWVAAHEPVEVRRFWPGEMARSASGVDHSRLVSALLDGFTPDPEDEPADALRRLGRYLLALGQMAPAEFDALALRSVRARAAAFAEKLEARLASFDLDGEGAALWAADVRRYLDVLQKHAADPDFGVPLDLLYGRDAEEARRLSQRLITNHGLVLFYWPELVEAAWRLKERGRGLAEEVRGASAVSFGQERMWLQDRLSPGSAAYNTANALRLSGSLDVPLLARCFAEIARRHEVLRSTFAERGGVPVQVVNPPAPVELPVADLSALPEDARTAELSRLQDEEFLRPFDLARGPLSRVRLVRLAAEEHVLLLTLHHIISDAWSMGVITGELAALHAAFAAGRPSPLPPLPVQYGDYARRQREWMAGPELSEQLAWWREHLAGSRALEVPTDRPRPAVRRFRGGMHTVRLPVPLAEAVRALCREREVTLFMALLAVFEILLHARTEETDLVVGVDVAGRTLPETEGLVGFFVNQLVLRVDLSGDPSFSEVLDRVRETAVSAFARQELPFGRLVEELAPKRSLSRNPLFQVMFGLYNVPEADLDLGGIAVSPVDVQGGAAVFDLSLYMAEAEDGILAMLRYDADLFEASTVDRLLADYEILLRRAVEAPGERVSALLAHLAAEKRSRIEAGRESLAQTRLKTLKTVRRRTVDDPKETP